MCECVNNQLRCLKYLCEAWNEHTSESLKQFCFKSSCESFGLSVMSQQEVGVCSSTLTRCSALALLSFLPHLVHKPSGWGALVVVANGDLPDFPQVRRLDGELVLCALLKVVLVVVEVPLPWPDKDNQRRLLIWTLWIVWETPERQTSLPVSPNSPKILMNTSASVPLDLMSAVWTLTTYLLSGKSISKIFKEVSQAIFDSLNTKVDIWRTFRRFHGIHGAQQVSDIEALPLHFAQPVVAGEVEPQMWPDHVCHYHPVQEPAGVDSRVVMFDSEAKDAASGWINRKDGPPIDVLESLSYLIFFRGPTLWVLIRNTSVLALSKAVRLLKWRS